MQRLAKPMADNQQEKAQAFKELNDRGELLLPNAWDGASARIFEEAGFPAIGTTSAGISYSRGLRDGENLDRSLAIQENGIVATAVSVPVNADIEAGYGTGASDVAKTVRETLDAGVVGVNIEDNTHSNALFDIREQSERLAGARAEADKRDIPLTINARTDTFILGLGADVGERMALTVERGKAYLDAGADLVFVPFVVDPEPIARLAEAFDGRLSVMAMPGAPSAAEMFKAGARRVSIGQIAMLSCLGHLAAIAQAMHLEGTWNEVEQSFFGFVEAEALFAKDGD